MINNKNKKPDPVLVHLREKAAKDGLLENIKQILDRMAIYGDRIAIVEKVPKSEDKLKQYTASQFTEDVRALGTALNDLGLKGKKIAVIGEGSYNWILSFFAVVCGTGIAVPLDKDLTDFELSKLISKADCEAIICSKTYYKMAKQHMEKDERLTHCIITNGPERRDDGFCMLDSLIEKGHKLILDGDTSYTDAVIHTDDIAAILFTSGTTGANKGVMLSHGNFCSNVEGIIASIPYVESTFSVLPMNHAYELGCDILTALYLNAVIYINDSLRNILTNFRLFKPDIFICVPLILEKIHAGIWEKAEASGKAQMLRKLIKLSNKLLSMGIDIRHQLFASVRKSFGANFPILVSGGAPARLEHVTGLYELGFTVYQGYGLTESSPIVTLNINAGTNPESAGLTLPDTNFRINDPDNDGIGEIWVRGKNIFKEYYMDEESTTASFDNGWFKTGDYGRTNEKNELFIVGRKKNLIILDNGKNVFPEDIESTIMEVLRYVREVVAIEAVKNIQGKASKIIAVNIYVSPEDFPDQTKDEIEATVRKDIGKVNKLMSAYKKISDVRVVYEEFPKTSTKKIIRTDVIAAYREETAVRI